MGLHGGEEHIEKTSADLRAETRRIEHAIWRESVDEKLGHDGRMGSLEREFGKVWKCLDIHEKIFVKKEIMVAYILGASAAGAFLGNGLLQGVVKLLSAH